MGENPGKEEIMTPDVIGVFIPIVLFVMVFSFASIAVWVTGRGKEREAFYKSENIRRVAESTNDGAKAAIDLLREESRLERLKKREGIKLGGLICVAVGVALMIFLGIYQGAAGPVSAGHERAVCLVGLIPGLIGVALLVYVHKYAAPVE